MTRFQPGDEVIVRTHKDMPGARATIIRASTLPDDPTDIKYLVQYEGGGKNTIAEHLITRAGEAKQKAGAGR